MSRPAPSRTLEDFQGGGIKKLDNLDLAILKAVGRGRVSVIPDESEDSGHTAWLVQQGYVAEEPGGLVLIEKGRIALGTTCGLSKCEIAATLHMSKLSTAALYLRMSAASLWMRALERAGGERAVASRCSSGKAPEPTI